MLLDLIMKRLYLRLIIKKQLFTTELAETFYDATKIKSDVKIL